MSPTLIPLLILQNVMTSQVLHNNVEATYITVEKASFYGVKQKPSRVLVNSQDAAFTYRDNQVRSGVNGLTQKTVKEKYTASIVNSTYWRESCLSSAVIV